MPIVSDTLDKLSSGNVLGATVKRVRFYTQYSAPVDYTPGDIEAASTSGGAGPAVAPNPWGSLLKPTFVVESPLSDRPYVFAPYGAADPTAYVERQMLLKWGPIGVAALLAGSFFFLGRASKR
jgi:hypothetical protein